MIFGASDVPDPSKVVYEGTTQPRFIARVTTRNPDSKLYPIHTHCSFTDADGTGATSVVASHFHRVRNNEILPDESDGHTHTISLLPCGAG